MTGYRAGSGYYIAPDVLEAAGLGCFINGYFYCKGDDE